MNTFIETLGKFIQFTEGAVNPIAKSAQLGNLEALLERYMDQKTLTLKDLIEKINKLRSELHPQMRKLLLNFWRIFLKK